MVYSGAGNKYCYSNIQGMLVSKAGIKDREKPQKLKVGQKILNKLGVVCL